MTPDAATASPTKDDRGACFARPPQHTFPVSHTVPPGGYTVADVARRLRAGPDKIREWIRKNQLRAINISSDPCGKPRWVILPEDLAAFEQRRQAGPAPKPPKKRRQTAAKDYFADL
jgi:hypothetical protein